MGNEHDRFWLRNQETFLEEITLTGALVRQKWPCGPIYEADIKGQYERKVGYYRPYFGLTQQVQIKKFFKHR